MEDSIITLKIERLGIHGEGVGYWNGLTLFVPGALPDEKIIAKIREKHKTYARAELIERLTTSPHRITPACPLFGKCGGCQLQHLSYHEQLKTKRQLVVDALERIGKLKDLEVLPCLSSPHPFHYRNKIQLPVSHNTLGLYAYNSHDLVEIDTCHIHCELGEEVFKALQQLLKEFPQEKLKHILIKTAVTTHQALVILVTKGKIDLMPLAKAIITSHPKIKGVVQNFHEGPANVILGKEYRLLVGQETIEEHFCRLTFLISPAAFFQVNPAQAETLAFKALEWASLQGNEIVLDAYCGVGTYSLLFAKRAKKVIGIECVPQAIENAIKNAQINGITNAKFICSTAEKFIPSLNEVDLVLLNPPRKGCDQNFLEKIALMRPQTILYISCNPATLARDLAYLSCHAYQVKKVQPFDMFPQTSHVETLVLMKL